MNYKETEAYLLEIPKFTKKNSMEVTRQFLEKLGNPCMDKRIIHVAGTNGKGSVCAYLSSVLKRGGYRVGLFTSPHLVSMRERFRINDEWICEEDFLQCFEKVRALSDTYMPTFFEMLFFMGMVYFEKENVDVILLETGLGGRLDATNSVKKKDLCIITKIGLDHTEYLGETVALIAGEKAGIMREETPVVFWDGEEDASAVIEEKAKLLSAPCFPVSKDGARNLQFHKNLIDFSYYTRYYGYVGCRLATTAVYQPQNAMLAVKALDVLYHKLPVTKAAIEQGLREMYWEGRMEEILPEVYLDGAHNADGMQAFLETVAGSECHGRRLLLFSVVRDKRYGEMIELLLDSGLFDKIYLTQLDSVRGLFGAELLEAFGQKMTKERKGDIAGCFSDAATAFTAVLAEKQKQDKVYIAGSLYLAGEIKKQIKRNNHD